MADGALVIGTYDPYPLTVHGDLVIGTYDPYPLTVHGVLVIGRYASVSGTDNSLFFISD